MAVAERRKSLGGRDDRRPLWRIGDSIVSCEERIVSRRRLLTAHETSSKRLEIPSVSKMWNMQFLMVRSPTLDARPSRGMIFSSDIHEWRQFHSASHILDGLFQILCVCCNRLHRRRPANSRSEYSAVYRNRPSARSSLRRAIRSVAGILSA